MKKLALTALFFVLTASSVFSQSYGTFKTRLIVNDDSTTAVNISQEMTSVFIEPLGIFGSHDNLGKYSFVWKSKKNTTEVTESIFTLPTGEADDFVFEWGPIGDRFDGLGNLITKFKIVSGSVRTERSGNTIRFYFNIIADDEGKKLEMRDGVFEYTKL